MSEAIPILLLFISGYLFKRLHSDQSEGLIDIVLYFIFPIFIIYKIHFLEFNSAIFKVVSLGVLAFTLGLLFSWMVARVFALPKKSMAMMIMSTAFGNTSFLGFAFVESYLGDYALTLAIFYDQIAVMVMLSIFTPIICSIGEESNTVQARAIVRSIITFPPTIAFFIAITTRPLPFAASFVDFLHGVSLTLVPLVVFAVGMKFTLTSIRRRQKEVALTLLIKMALIPLTLLGISLLFFDPTDIAIQTAIIESAMPPMVLATVLAIRAGLDKEMGIASLGIGMMLSFVTIPLWIALLKLM